MSDPLDSLVTQIERVKVDLPSAEEELTGWTAADDPTVSAPRRASVSIVSKHYDKGRILRLSCPKFSCGPASPQANPNVCTCALLQDSYQGWVNSGCIKCVNSPRLYTKFPRRTPKRMNVSGMKPRRQPQVPTSYRNVLSLLEKRKDLQLPQTPVLVRVKKTLQKPPAQTLSWWVSGRQSSAERYRRRGVHADAELRVQRRANFFMTN